jgi:HD-GYP domain-containing protein (c-di-GMP phosphodiesterase class II)
MQARIVSVADTFDAMTTELGISARWIYRPP